MAKPVKTVDKLTITFFVDSDIEWFVPVRIVNVPLTSQVRFTKLPPGFNHEIKIHLGEHEPAINPVTGVPILEFEKYCCGEYNLYLIIHLQH